MSGRTAARTEARQRHDAGAPGGALNLIHSTNCSNPASMRVCGELEGFEKTLDDQAGMDWWNSLTQADRAFWLRAALTAIPAGAWNYYKGCRGAPDATKTA